MKNSSRIELIVDNFDNTRAFYLELLHNFKLTVDGSFITSVENDNNFITLRTPTPFTSEKSIRKKVLLKIHALDMDDIYDILKGHKLSIEQVDRDKKGLITMISSFDLEGNELILKSIFDENQTESCRLNKTKIFKF